MYELNKDFLKMMDDNFSESEKLSFINSMSNKTVKHIRYNPFKSTTKPSETQIPWCDMGYTLSEDKVFTTDPIFHAGAYYVQEASSMYLEEIFKKVILPEIPEPVVLDLCAAPGGKSTHISSMIGENGVLVANEVIKSRAYILKENIIKWGIGNTIVTNSDPKYFSKLKSLFDVVVADVPCSGEGMFRKNEKARDEWSYDNVMLCASRSQRIIADVWDSLKEGGYFVFSTCTFNRYENEQNIEWILQNFDVESVDIDLDLYDERIVKTQTNGINAYRFFPHKVDSEGYFVCVFRKGGDYKIPKKRKNTKKIEKINKNHEKTLNAISSLNIDNYIVINGVIYIVNNSLLDIYTQLLENVYPIYVGVEMGEVLNNKFKPSHPLSLWHKLPLHSFPRVEVDNQTALEYLRRKTIDFSLFTEGYNLVCYQNLPLGFVKRISNRVNNLYSKDSMILHL